jgi:DNA polymerase-1
LDDRLHYGRADSVADHHDFVAPSAVLEAIAPPETSAQTLNGLLRDDRLERFSCRASVCRASSATEQPRAVLVGWDTLEVPTYRHEKFPTYQSGREFDDALVEQLDVLPEFVAACGFQNAKAPGYEADDFLASAAGAEEKRGGTVLIASGDRDTFQLASDRTTILYPLRAGEMARIDPAEVRARYGVDPAQVPDFIALRGDPSDKVPGAAGVGAVGAARLLEKYGSLEATLAAGRFPAQAESLRLYRSIATMDRKAPLPSLRNQKPTWHKAADLARNWELNQLAHRLEELASN